MRIDSHVNGAIDVSRDLVQLQTSKSTKARGRWQAQLVPRKNYLNLIHPNDVINIYIDPGDGRRGFVRTMLGYIDRVERSEQVDEKGAITTRFVLIGSDFQKAIDQTSIYFNSYMRTILDERFVRTGSGAMRPTFSKGTSGLALRNAGITITGTPADFIENFLQILLGFGQQWQLPDSYSRKRDAIEDNRRKRKQRALDKIPSDILEKISLFGQDPEGVEFDVEQLIRDANAFLVSTEAKENTEEAKKRRDAADALSQNAALLAYRNTIETTDPSYPTGLLDLLSLDFIETLAIDGYNQNDTVWQAGSQTLGQYIYGHSNEIVNELIFDLRPAALGKNDLDGGLVDGGYSKLDDELGLNKGTESFPSSVTGVRYVPAVVFRQYPYSTVEGINLNQIQFLPPGDSDAEAVTPGYVYFGPIFASSPNVGGRHLYQYPSPLNPVPSKFSENQPALAHLDVVVINNSDVVSANIGRSDDDLLNLFQMFPRSVGAATEHYREQLANFSPVINQISIARHGLRNREMTTEFASYFGSRDNRMPRRNLVRWSLLHDHWYQHNIEYLSGTIQLRGMPEIRAGYRLDWEGRNESYYVDSVSHNWAYPGALRTTVQVSRGQRNDPFPAYIPPVFINSDLSTVSSASGNRSANGRLADFFFVKDTNATTNATDKDEDFIANQSENDLDKATRANRGGKAVYPASEQNFIEGDVFIVPDTGLDPGTGDGGVAV
jgi:hypothetical protein